MVPSSNWPSVSVINPWNNVVQLRAWPVTARQRPPVRVGLIHRRHPYSNSQGPSPDSWATPAWLDPDISTPGASPTQVDNRIRKLSLSWLDPRINTPGISSIQVDSRIWVFTPQVDSHIREFFLAWFWRHLPSASFPIFLHTLSLPLNLIQTQKPKVIH